MESRDKLPQPIQVDPLSHCKEKDVDDCWFYFTYSVNGNNEAIVHVVETPGRNLIMSKILLIFFYALLFRPVVRFSKTQKQPLSTLISGSVGKFSFLKS